MASAATAKRYSELGFRVIEGGKSGKLAVLKTPSIGEIFGLRHDHVLRDIRQEQEKLSPNLGAAFAEHCRPSTYRGNDNTERPCFELSKVGLAAIAAKYDVSLRFLLALAFDALEHDDAGADVIRQINQRIRELRSRASGQDELTLELPPMPVEAPRLFEPAPNPNHPHHTQAEWDAMPVAARQEWWEKYASAAQLKNYNDDLLCYPSVDADAPQTREHLNIDLATLDRYTAEGWYVRRRHDATGKPLMVWITSDDAISTSNKYSVPGPTGPVVTFCLTAPFPPIELVLNTYDSLGYGPYAPVAKATLRHFLA